MKSRSALIIIFLACILGFGILEFKRWEDRIKGEYLTADMIRITTQYVEDHQGNWPKSWKDLNQGPKVDKSVQMDFSISSEEIVRNKELIYRAILPVKGNYIMYPHAKEQLEYLFEEIRKMKTGNGPQVK